MTIKIGSAETIGVEIEALISKVEPAELTGDEKYCVFIPSHLLWEVHMLYGDHSKDSDSESLLEFDRGMTECVLFIKESGVSGLYEEALYVEFNSHERNLIENILKNPKNN